MATNHTGSENVIPGTKPNMMGNANSIRISELTKLRYNEVPAAKNLSQDELGLLVLRTRLLGQLG